MESVEEEEEEEEEEEKSGTINLIRARKQTQSRTLLGSWRRNPSKIRADSGATNGRAQPSLLFLMRRAEAHEY